MMAGMKMALPMRSSFKMRCTTERPCENLVLRLMWTTHMTMAMARPPTGRLM